MSSAPRVVFLGMTFPAMASIVGVAKALGYSSPTTAYRVAERDDWPVSGPVGGRKVNLIALADQLGIPYEIIAPDQTEELVGAGSR